MQPAGPAPITATSNNSMLEGDLQAEMLTLSASYLKIEKI
jgi:hypothetical protein